MVGEETTRELSIDEKVGWSTLVLQKGEVVEIYVPRSNLTIQAEEWCAFVVLGTHTQTDASLVAEVKFLGCPDAEITKLLQEEINGRGRKGLLHFCPSQPCTEVVGEPFTIHVLQVRISTLEEFSAPFMDAKLRSRARQWLRREKGDEEEDPLPAGGLGDSVMKRPAGSRPGRSKRLPKSKPKDPSKEDGTKEGRKMTASMKAKLRGRLEEVKKKAALAKAGVESVEESSEGPVPSTQDSEEEASDCVEEPTTGTRLKAHPPSLALALAEGGKSKEKVTTTVKKIEKKKKSKKRKEKASPLELPPELGAIKDITSKDLRGQLVRRAVIADQLKNKEKKHKKGKKDAAKRLREALTDVLSPKDVKKHKKDKRKKKKKRRIRADGVIESLSSSSSESSEEYEDETESSLEELETPMKQKSKERPGSVLKMLTQHVQEQLEQAATTEMDGGQSSLVGGVKILTYFALQVKPSFPGQMREMREMYECHGCTSEGRDSQSGRCPSGTIHGYSPIAFGSELVHGEIHGDLPARGIKRSFQQYGIGYPKAHQACSQDARDTSLARCLSRTWKRWKGGLVPTGRPQRRRQRWQKQGKERKRQGKRPWRCLAHAGQRVEGQQGKARREIEVKTDMVSPRGWQTPCPQH